MQRRNAIKLLSSVVSLPLLSKSTFGITGKKVWKTAVGLNGFASGERKYKKSYPIWEVLHFCSQTDFDGIELVSNWPMGQYPDADENQRIDALRRMYDGFGLQIFSIQLGVAQAFSPKRAVREAWLEEFRNRANYAKKAGCDCIGMWPGGDLRGQSIDEAIERISKSFHQAAQIAEDLGLLTAFEIEPPFVFNTEEHLKRILAQSDHPNLKAIYDPSHFDMMSGSTGNPHEMLQRVGVENIGYVHFTDTDGTLRDGGTSKHLPCGEGHVDIQKSLQVLYEGGFRGWIMIDSWEIPDPYEACKKGKQAIDLFLKQRG